MKTLKEFVDKYPNDMELGKSLRKDFSLIEDDRIRVLVMSFLTIYPNDSDLGRSIRDSYYNANS